MYSLEDRVYFDGAAADTVATVQKEAIDASSSDSSSSATQETSQTNTDKQSSQTDNSSDNSATATTSSAVENALNAHAAQSSSVDINALINEIINSTSSSNIAGKNVLIVSSAIQNATDLEAAASTAGITVVSYDPANETMTTLLQEIEGALGGSKAISLNFALADNNSSGFQLVSASTIDAGTASADSAFWTGTSSLLTEGGRMNFTGDASLTDAGASDLAEAIASSSGHSISFLDSETGIASLTVAPEAASTSIYFIDSSVKDSDLIVSALPQDATVVYLTAGGDGIQEITDYLSGKTGISSINIITHGHDGYLMLGNDVLDNTTINSLYSDEVSSWGSSLAEKGTVNIFSCNTASSDSGKAFVNTIGTLTGATVEASTDATGASGNWTL